MIYTPSTKKLILTQCFNFKVLEGRIFPLFEVQGQDTEVLMWIAMKLLNYQVKQDPTYIERMMKARLITEEMTERIIEFMINSTVQKNENDPLKLIEVLKFLRVLRSCSSSIGKFQDFYEDFFGLITALRLSRESLKKLLLANAENRDVLKKWALIARKSKDFYDSDEAKFIHILFHKCLINPLQS